MFTTWLFILLMVTIIYKIITSRTSKKRSMPRHRKHHTHNSPQNPSIELDMPIENPILLDDFVAPGPRQGVRGFQCQIPYATKVMVPNVPVDEIQIILQNQ